jgi:hypothetical protein
VLDAAPIPSVGDWQVVLAEIETIRVQGDDYADLRSEFVPCAAQTVSSSSRGNNGTIRAQILATLSAADRAIMNRWARRIGITYIALAVLMLMAGFALG